MTKQQQFELCVARAARIVAAYRAEAPEGCDPQATWVAVAVGVGSVAAAGISAASSAKAGKDAKGAAGTAAKSYQSTAQQSAGAIGEAGDKALSLLQPFEGKFNLRDLLQRVIQTNSDLLPQAQQYAKQVNDGNQKELDKYLGRALPGVKQMVSQASNNTLSMLRGEIPADVAAGIRRRDAGKALQGGFGGSESSRALEARDLGLTSLDLMNEGGNAAQRWIGTARTHLMAPLFDPSSLLGDPRMELSTVLAGADFAYKQAGIITDTAARQAQILTSGGNAATGAQMQGAEASIKADQASSQAIASGIQGATGAFGSYMGTRPSYSPTSTGGYGSMAAAGRAAPFAGSVSSVPGVGYVPTATRARSIYG